jgi:iron complex transport system substrate-binding protein
MIVLSLFAQKLFKKAASRRIICAVVLGVVILITNVGCEKRAYHPAALPEEISLSEACRVIRHALGETCIPQNPKHIITLDIYSLGNSIALGIEPIASGSNWLTGGLPDYLKSSAKNIKYVGTECQPSIERLLLLKPDLILGTSGCSQNYSLLSKIAPTILSDLYVNTSWQEYFNFISYVLGKESSAQVVWNRYYTQVKRLHSILDKKQQNIEVAVVDVFASQIFPYTKNSFIGSILDDIGLKMPKSQNIVSEFGFVTISEEEIPKIDCDILFVVIGNRDEEKFLEDLNQKPLWKKLRAVQTNHVYPVEEYVWLGGNPIAANLVLDDLEKYLVGKT